MEDELWKTIDNWDYQISNFGNVKSNISNKIIKSWNNKNGYTSVTLHRNGTKRNFYIHRLVAKYFVENKNPKSFFEINHIDENKKNNHYSNLEWCDRAYNCQYSECGNAISNYNSIAICKIDSNGNKTVYQSIKQAAKENNINRYNLGEAVRTGKLLNNCIWKKVKNRIKFKIYVKKIK